ncbi:MAG: hypothetical protein GY859_07470 [Desulfobacterales bacterium]|nr:hypothetical protein [Desulfobacterales bacterium]
MRNRVTVKRRMALFLILFFLCATPGCRPGAGPSEDVSRMDPESAGMAPRSAEDFLIVDCLLPGRVRKLGKMTYLTPRRPVKTTGLNCEIRGGEYTTYDRANYQTALKVWMASAEAGDMKAQNYVGEIYKGGLGMEPRYDLAAQWFQKAADQGFAPARWNLGWLYEMGLGVRRDSTRALNLYREASGLDIPLTLDQGPGQEEIEARKRLEQKVKRLEEEKKALQRSHDRILEELDDFKNRRDEHNGKIRHLDEALKRARIELDKQKKDADASARTQQEQLERRIAELRDNLERARKDKKQLEKKIAASESNLKVENDKLTNNQKKIKDLPGPGIKVIDPRPKITRDGGAYILIGPGKNKRWIRGRVTTASGALQHFTVDDKLVHPEEDGRFKVQVELPQSGKKRMRIIAIDRYDKQTDLRLTLATEENLPGECAPEGDSYFDFGAYHALIIGNQDYQNMPKLKTPVNDARTAAQILGVKYGFETTVLENADRDTLIKKLTAFRERLDKNDNFLLFYAGHGKLDPANQKGFWMPIDVNPQERKRLFSIYELTKIIEQFSAKKIIIIADACYSGALASSSLPSLDSDMIEEERIKKIKEMSGIRSRMVLSSGELTEILDSDGGSHSIFASHFFDLLKSNDDILEGRRLFELIKDEIRTHSRKSGLTQTPGYGVIAKTGHVGGDFIFAPVNFNRGNVSANTGVRRNTWAFRRSGALETMGGDLRFPTE